MVVTPVASWMRRSSLTQGLAHRGVQRPERLVQQQHAGIDRQSRGRAPPAGAGRQTAGTDSGRRVPIKLDQLQEFLDAGLDGGLCAGLAAPFRTSSPKAMLRATLMWRNRAYCWNTNPTLRAAALA